MEGDGIPNALLYISYNNMQVKIVNVNICVPRIFTTTQNKNIIADIENKFPRAVKLFSRELFGIKITHKERRNAPHKKNFGMIFLFFVTESMPLTRKNTQK